MNQTQTKYPMPVKIWLVAGVAMIFFQIIVGGITRLTGSGLSITKWEIVTGTLPPLNSAQWDEAFSLYQLTPQYQKINQGMSMAEFKFIYFWEYLHRLWGRIMGFVFLFPFLIFGWKGWIDKWLAGRLLVVLLLAAVVASFGWIMVASGLVDRPWVNAYKLTLHLGLALLTFGYLLWVTYGVVFGRAGVIHNSVLKRWNNWLLFLLTCQILLGGMMSGMKAALIYPTWPMMLGEWIPSVLWEPENWRLVHFTDYDKHTFMPALVQTLHRLTAYALVIMGLWYLIRWFGRIGADFYRKGMTVFGVALLAQVVLGILTLLASKGEIPVGLGVFHQAFAILLLAAVLFLQRFSAKAAG
jgi:cytochrome c oxidase assembly protein subunit 15